MPHPQKIMNYNLALSKWAAEKLDVPILEAPVMALSLHQPWCELIFAGKDVENRFWTSKKRGWIFMHASKSFSPDEYECALGFAGDNLSDLRQIPPPKGLRLGGIVGAIRIAPSIVSRSPWAMDGQLQIPILDARRLPFVPCRGSQRWFIPQCSPPE